MITSRLCFGIAGVFGLLGIMTSALLAHALKGKMDEQQMGWMELATRMQILHSILIAGLAASCGSDHPWVRRSILFFTAGVILFSGSLYGLAMTKILAFAHITPFGGVALIGGWFCLILQGLTATSKPRR